MEVRLASASTAQQKQEPEPETGMAGLFCFSIVDPVNMITVWWDLTW